MVQAGSSCGREHNAIFVGWVSALARNPTWEPRNVGLRADQIESLFSELRGRANPTYGLNVIGDDLRDALDPKDR